MPKTANKRTQARRKSEIQRAHGSPPPIVRKVPRANRPTPPRGPVGFVRRFPFATSIIVVVVLFAVVFVAHATRFGPFAPPQAYHLPCQQPTTRTWSSAPKMTINTSKQYTATIHTAKGDIVIALDAKDTPIAVNNFVFLAEHNYYCGTYFWRVEKPGAVSPVDGQPSQLSLIQGGSVTKNGQDSASTPGYTIPDEKVVGGYTPGTVAMAKTSAPNSASAQFFIDIGDETQYFQKVYQIFGHVTSGMDVVKKITPDDVMEGVSITEK
jgi:cyclophilin family peptidyl-prolyl cis-trans isomerase